MSVGLAQLVQIWTCIKTQMDLLWSASGFKYSQQFKQTNFKWFDHCLCVVFTLILVFLLLHSVISLSSKWCLSLPLSLCLTCTISRICNNRSGVNVNFLTYIISSLHNLTEAQTLTENLRHTVATVPLCCLCLLFTAAGTWSLNSRECKDDTRQAGR